MAENCFHCGQEIQKDRISFDEKEFCCNGCKSVYEILNAKAHKGAVFIPVFCH